MRRLLLACIVVLFSMGALPAQAHAELISTEPSDGSQLDESPGVIRLIFNEPVGLPVEALRVFDSTGARVDEGDADHGGSPDEVVVTIPELAVGSYVVTWRAISQDDHPIRGAFLFEVGEAGLAVDESLIASLTGGSRDVPFAAAGWMSRWASYLAALVAAGAAVFVFRLEVTQAPASLIGKAAAVAIIGSFLQVVFFAAESTGLGWSALVSVPSMTDAFTSPLALASLVRTIAVAVIWIAVRRGIPLWSLVGVAGIALAEVLTGHTRSAEPAWLVIAADAVHVIAAAVWVGGLAAFALSLRAAGVDSDAIGGARLVGRFSRMATWSVVALLVGGATLAWSQVRVPRALVSTTYGWTLVAKTLLAGSVLAVGAYNNRVLVPAITGPTDGSDLGGPASSSVVAVAPATTRAAWNRLSRTVRIELAGLVTVLAVTALLVNLQPAAEAAGFSGPVSTYVPFGDQQMNLVVDPNRAGFNTVHATFLSTSGINEPLDGTVTFEFEMPEQDIGPIVREPRVGGPNHVIHTGSELAIPGVWRITVRQRVSEFAEEVAVVEITVNG